MLDQWPTFWFKNYEELEWDIESEYFPGNRISQIIKHIEIKIKVHKDLSIDQLSKIKLCYSIKDHHKVNFKVVTPETKVHLITEAWRIFLKHKKKVIFIAANDKKLEEFLEDFNKTNTKFINYALSKERINEKLVYHTITPNCFKNKQLIDRVIDYHYIYCTTARLWGHKFFNIIKPFECWIVDQSQIESEEKPLGSMGIAKFFIFFVSNHTCE